MNTGKLSSLCLIGLFNLAVGAHSVSAQTFYWAKKLGGTLDDVGNSAAVDASGNVLTTGSFQGSADFNPGAGNFTMVSQGFNDIFISKLDASGNFVWAKRIGGAAGNDVALDIVVDAAGSVYTIGYFSGTVDFNPGAGVNNFTSGGIGGYNDIFISKLDASGNYVWARHFAGLGSYDDQGYSIALDGSGNIYSTGYIQGQVDFDPGAGIFNLSAIGSGTDIFICKLDATGSFLWAKKMGGSSGDRGQSITCNAGGVFSTGYFSGTADFNPGAGVFNLVAVGSYEAFVSKLDANGNFLWAKNFGEMGYGVAVDGSGDVLTTGYYQGTSDFDPGAGINILVSVGGTNDIFISKLSSAGNFVWAKSIGGPSTDYSFALFTDASGGVYVSGYFLGTADFDPGAGTVNLTSAGGADIFISGLDAAGNYAGAKCIGGTGWDAGRAITGDVSGNIYLTGYFNSTVDFDPWGGSFPLTSTGQNDVFVLKLGTGLLPVELLYFEAKVKEDRKVLCAWATAAEINNEYFEVECSTDGLNFEVIARVSGAGNSNSTRNYSLTDPEPLPGTTYYRLKQVDYDGVFQYSGVVAVRCSEDTVVHVYPNPFRSELNFTCKSPGGLMEIFVFNALGQLVSSQKFNDAALLTMKIEGDNGIYFIQILSDQGLVQALKVLKE